MVHQLFDIANNFLAWTRLGDGTSKDRVRVEASNGVPNGTTAGARSDDRWQLEHVTGKYMISDRPMTADE